MSDITKFGLNLVIGISVLGFFVNLLFLFNYIPDINGSYAYFSSSLFFALSMAWTLVAFSASKWNKKNKKID